MSCYGIEETVEKMKGRVLASAAEVEGNLVLTFKEGEPVKLAVEGDCCSRSWILDVSHETFGSEGGPMTGEYVTEDVGGSDNDPIHDVLRIHKTIFKAERCPVVVLWANASNGYYDGFWVNA